MSVRDLALHSSLIKRAVLLILTFAAAGLSIYLLSIVPSKQFEHRWLSGKLGIATPVKSRPRDVRKRQLLEQSEFMVWQQESQAVADELLQILREDINQNPFSASAWRDLTFVDKRTSTPIAQRVWALERALVLSRWNKVELTKLTHHCVNEYRVFQRAASDLCSELTRRLPNDAHLPVLAQQLGVSPAQLIRALEAEGLAEMINR